MAALRPLATPAKIRLLGRYLKQLREELGLSMHDVAKKTDLTPGYISKIEAGDIFKSINVDSLIAFSKAYGIPITALLEEAGFLDKEDDLPQLSTYLKTKYKLSPQVIRDIEIFKEFIEGYHKKLRK